MIAIFYFYSANFIKYSMNVTQGIKQKLIDDFKNYIFSFLYILFIKVRLPIYRELGC